MNKIFFLHTAATPTSLVVFTYYKESLRVYTRVFCGLKFTHLLYNVWFNPQLLQNLQAHILLAVTCPQVNFWMCLVAY